jgi:hypothetical protein
MNQRVARMRAHDKLRDMRVRRDRPRLRLRIDPLFEMEAGRDRRYSHPGA